MTPCAAATDPAALGGDAFAAAPAAPSQAPDDAPASELAPYPLEGAPFVRLRAWCHEAGIDVPAVASADDLRALLRAKNFTPKE